MNRKSTLATLAGCLVFAGLLFNQNAASLSGAKSCKDIAIVFARGSGQSLNDDDAAAFFSKIKERLPEQLTSSEYDLGSASYSNYKYPAVAIDDNWVKIAAKISSGYGHKYGDSVQSGMLELYHYLEEQKAECPNTKYILGGFSQGAQVVGHTLQFLSEEIRSNVVFTALFGDPKLHLPEGEGFPAPACLEWNFSAWRRTVDNCHTSAGVLGARNPYIPDDMKNKTGLWCLAQDYVCGSTNLPWEVSGHDKYKDPGGPIDQAAQEIAEKLKTAFTYQTHIIDVNTAPDINKLASLKDTAILFIVDRSVNMRLDYPNLLTKMRRLAQQLGPDVKIGFDIYMGCWNSQTMDKAIVQRDYANPPFTQYRHWASYGTSWVDSFHGVGENDDTPYFEIEPGCDLSQELDIHVTRAVRDFIQYHGSPEPRGDTSVPLWPKDATRRIIVPITNTAYSPPTTNVPYGSNGLYTHATTSSPTTLIYPLVPDDILESFDALQPTGDAKVRLLNNDKIGDTLLATYGTNPQIDARLNNTDYRIPPGYTATFSASRSIVHDDTIAKYEWDFNNDGEIDETTTKPSTSHTYASAPHDNLMTVRVVTASGLSDTASANVQIINLADVPPTPKAPQNLKLEPTGENSVNFSWTPSDALADKWIIYFNDFPLGYTEKSQTSIEITDLRTSEDTTFGVRAVSSEYQHSGITSITLAAKKSSPLQDDTSLPPIPESQPFTPATNILEALTHVLGFGNTASSLSKTTDDQHEVTQKSPLTLIYYILGGIIALFLMAYQLYKHHKNRRTIQ